MSIELVSKVWTKQVSGNTQTILLVLCDFANDNGVCWPSQALVAWKAGCTDRTVRNVLSDLEEVGAIHTISCGKGRGHTSVVRINLDALPDKENKPEKSSGFHPVKTETLTGKPEIAVSEQPSIEPSDTTPLPPKGEKARKPRKVVSYSPEFEAWWKQYPSGRGIKIDAFEEWQLLSDADRAEAMAALPAWTASTKWQTEPQYIPHAERWLNKRRWEGAPPPSAAQDYTKIPNLTAPPGKVTRIDWDELLPDGTKRYRLEGNSLIDRTRVRP